MEKYCYRIYSYNRVNGIGAFSLMKPYIVKSRINKLLIERLNEDDHQIILEGIHCSGVIPYLNNSTRLVIRMHNDESHYYKQLAGSERNLFKKCYYIWESSLLKRHQKKLNRDIPLACLSLADIKQFKEVYKFNNLQFIPCFIPWQLIKSKTGKGSFCLYHGNMGISENIAAALWLIRNVFNKASIPLVIAGKNIPGVVYKASRGINHINLINNPTIGELETLVFEAHVHIIPSMNDTGVKLKLLHALTEGRFTITKSRGLRGSGVSTGVHIADTSQQTLEYIQKLFEREFTNNDIAERQYIIDLYNNRLNAEKLSELY